VPVRAEKVVGFFAFHSEGHEEEAGGKQKQGGGFGCGGGGGLFGNGEGVENGRRERQQKTVLLIKGVATWNKTSALH
jgi:hypothetical protein